MAPTVRPALIPSVCASDSKHFVRRVYVFGLKKPDNMSMRTYLYKIHGITSIGILFSHHIAFGITEMIVRVNHVWKLTNAFNMTRQIHLKGFDPLNPNEPQHFLLSHEQLSAFPDLYMASVKATFGNPQCVGGALESYASDYAREIGVFI
ncbi:hypothetical protein FBU59_001708 [Linderina macrospora]|uniref:Uncharacterized protein n=1 Tax=Linderina macrospora TaxID=4868 RepID=A0ACC1JDB4_9FUNG|nr:hypothetical protein FBU59_001708 [Linderina macrospora]